MEKPTPEPLVTGILYNEIPVQNLDESIAWYQEHLGLPLVWRVGAEGQAQLGLSGGPLLFLVEAPATARAHFERAGGEYSVIGFHSPDIERLHRRLREHGVRVEPAIRADAEGNRFFWFYDLNGNRFEVQGEPSAP